MKEILDGILENLTLEQKEKVSQCKTSEELVALIGGWGYEITDELLDAVTGGRMVSSVFVGEDNQIQLSPKDKEFFRIIDPDYAQHFRAARDFMED